jgi:plastocyanin
MPKSILHTLAILGNVVVLSGCFSSEPIASQINDVDCNTVTPPANTRIVRIRNFAFEPAQLQVSPGTRVVWVNCETSAGSGFAHTSTANNGAWNSGLLSPRGVGKFEVTLNQAGTFNYFCQPHPGMTGRVVVQ